MIAAFTRRLLYRLMHKRAERHAGCRIDVARLRVDPEYASAIRALARFTLDEELRLLGAMIESESLRETTSTSAPVGRQPATGARILPFRRPLQA